MPTADLLRSLDDKKIIVERSLSINFSADICSFF